MLRVLSSVLLSLVLVVTSHSAAMARGAPHAVDQMVICVGAAAVVVYVDDEGQPVEAPHLCPDCALHLLAALVPQDVVPGVADGTLVRILYPTVVHDGGSAWGTASARAPPFEVI